MTRSQLLRRTGASSQPVRCCRASPSPTAAPSPAHPSSIALSTNIPNLETPAQYLRTTITPNDVFYVRTHWASNLGKKAEGWSMRVEGLFGRPLELDLAALQALPKYEVVHVLQCSGNGRELSRPHVTGSQWRIGAAGNAVWGGTRVADIIAKAGGLGHGVRYLTGIGGETPPDPELMKPVTRGDPGREGNGRGTRGLRDERRAARALPWQAVPAVDPGVLRGQQHQAAEDASRRPHDPRLAVHEGQLPRLFSRANRRSGRS